MRAGEERPVGSGARIAAIYLPRPSGVIGALQQRVVSANLINYMHLQVAGSVDTRVSFGGQTAASALHPLLEHLAREKEKLQFIATPASLFEGKVRLLNHSAIIPHMRWASLGGGACYFQNKSSLHVIAESCRGAKRVRELGPLRFLTGGCDRQTSASRRRPHSGPGYIDNGRLCTATADWAVWDLPVVAPSPLLTLPSDRYSLAQLLRDVRYFLKEESDTDVILLATKLSAVGYSVNVRTALGGGGTAGCFR